MATAQEIADQQSRLAQHRANVQTLLQQIAAQGGWMHAPVTLLNNLAEQRGQIARCKAILRSWRAPVENHPDDDPAKNVGELEQAISELEASRTAPLPTAVRQAIEHLLASAPERLAALGSVSATQQFDGQSQVNQAIGVNFGTVQAFFGTQPQDGAALLNDYLDSLGRECEHLRLSRLTGRHQSGAEQRAAPPLRLQAVYTSLTTDGPQVVLERHDATVAQAREALKQERTPDDAPPEQVRLVDVSSDRFAPDVRERGLTTLRERVLLQGTPPDLPCTLWITRPELALEAVATQRRLVLLGEPGAGKSTVLRYLALLLAQRLRGSTDALPGWPAQDLPIPIVCPLGRVAAALPQHGHNADRALDLVLLELLEGEVPLYAGLREHLKAAMRGAGVLFLFDGLDELPAEAGAGRLSPRAAVAEAIGRLAGKTRGRIVVTSRVLPYRAQGDWQLPADEGWEVRSLAPLAFGQVRTFVQSWYVALAEGEIDPELDHKRAQTRAEALIGELEASPALRPLIASPLLLTMLAVLHYNTDEVPRDRAKLYEECVLLLLERWEPVRTPGQWRPGLLERLGSLPGLELDLLRGAIHELAFQAHDRPPSDDGRGLLDGDALRGRMLRLFERVASPNPARTLATFIQVLREDAGLLLERSDGQYAFPHLTFQEYLAACHLADRQDMADLAHQRWHGPDRERWREVLRLLVGRLRQQGKVQTQALPWLQRLIGQRSGTTPKTMPARRRDAVLATLVYEELGAAALSSSALDVEDAIHDPLRAALLDLLAEHDPAISTADRVRAGFLLGKLGDPRVPVTIEEWQDEVRKLQAGDSSGYFCRVEAGTYWIGSADDDPDAREKEKPRHTVTFEQPFWIGCFPITNAQWGAWVEAGGQRSRLADNTDLNHPNQPVVGMTWDMAAAFCTWLGTQLGVEVRLPHEAEWEAAARGPEGRRYPWGDEWAEDRAATKEDREVRGGGWSVPVGCYPAGAAACGTLDMAGNVWEWTADVWESYPGGKKPFREDWPVLRGGYYGNERTSVRCGARDWDHHDSIHRGRGLRVVVGPERAGG
ncbi:MAG TPA: SUMF1/EgtB/PvdO family nonheme iron enzyme [Roseiflexaceae bacterium]|nr:SUMF1/EgtB/PvdO family nonheme iron enzyme [Roseiflexaceae bacterium]